MQQIKQTIIERILPFRADKDELQLPLFPNSKRPRIVGKLHVVNPEPSDKYKLLIFAPRDLPAHTQFNQIINVFNEQEFGFELCLRRTPTLPDHICVWLFVSQLDDDELQTQIVLGCGSTRLTSLANETNVIQLVDSGDQSTQARLDLFVDDLILDNKHCLLDLLKHPVARERQILSNLLPLAQEYIDEVKNYYKNYTHNNEAFFCKVVSPMGDLPLLSWTLLTTQIYARNSEAQSYFSHLLDISLDRLGLTLSDCVPKKPFLSDILAEMVLWQERAKVYSYDTSRTSEHQHIGSDQWTRLGCMPDQRIATGDCEDFAESMLETLYQFKRTQFSPQCTELLAVQDHLKHYTSCLTIGQLKSDSGYVGHAYVTLLDQRWLRDLVKFDKSRKPKFFESNFQTFKREALYPPIFLEGTAYTQSTWSLQNLKQNKDDIRLYSNSQLIFNTTETMRDPEKWERIIKFRIPASTIMSSQKYGQVYTLLAADLYAYEMKEYNAVQLLLSESNDKNNADEKPSVGANQQALAVYSPKIKIDCALRWRPNQVRQMLHLLRDMPNTSFASPPQLTQDTMLQYQKNMCFNSKNNKVAEFDIRLVDFQQFEKSIRLAVQQLKTQLADIDFSLTKTKKNSIDELYQTRYQIIPISNEVDLMNIAIWKTEL